MSNLDIVSVSRRLASLESVREYLIKRSRDISQLSKKLISYTLRGSVEESITVLNQLTEAYRSMVSELSRCPEFLYSNLLYSIAAEYVEASQFHSVVFEGVFRSPEELGVHPIPYVLGLLDLIGELKRFSLELLRREEYGKSFSYLEVAEDIYEKLSELNITDAVVPGFRKKLDVYRRVIDNWRILLIDIESRIKLESACRSASETLKQSGNRVI